MLSEVTAVVFIPLTQGKVAVIDFDDFEKIRGIKWCAQKSGHRFYAMRRVNNKQVMLHRFLLGALSHEEVDHEDGNGLNDRRYNIRRCSHAQNVSAFQTKRKGSSRFRGVHWHKRLASWAAQIRVQRKAIHLGYFKAEELAAKAYDQKAKELLGEFASPNFPV